MANPPNRNPIIIMDVHHSQTPPELLKHHPNNQLTQPARDPDYTEDSRQMFWFDEMIMLSHYGHLRKLSVCPETKFLMYLQTDLPLKWIVIDPMWGNDKSINAAFQSWVIERTVLDEDSKDRS